MNLAITLLIALLVQAHSAPVATTAPAITGPAEKLLNSRLSDAEAALAERLGASADEATRFALGIAQFLRGVERVGQDLHRYGFQTDPRMGLGLGLVGMVFPGARLPIPPNASPETITYEDLRTIIERFVSHCSKAEKTLAGMGAGDVKLPFAIGQVRMDLDGDGQATDAEALWRVYQRLNSVADADAEVARTFVIQLDRADAEWLRGYCRLLMAMGDFFLAWDMSEQFAATGHLLFAKPQPSNAFLSEHTRGAGGFDMDVILDLVAYVHLMRFEVREPERLQRCVEDLQAMIGHSRKMIDLVLAETDDDHEWIPSPRQISVLTGAALTDEMVAGWREFLDEASAILEGKKLIPFWRGTVPRGVNLRRALLESRRFDLVLWVQGAAAAPYLEQGELTRPETWERLDRVFGGEFIGFAFWLN